MQLWSHIPIDSLPKKLGGKLELNHTGWLIECLQSVTYQGSDFTDFSADLLLTTPGKNHSTSWTDVSHSQGSSEEGQPSVEGSQGSDDGLNSRKKSFDKKLSGLVLPNGHPHSTPLASEGSEDESSASLPSEYSHPMNMEQLLEHVKSHGKAGLYAEYAELKSSSLFGSFEVSRSRPNMCKNRYTDVLCYDHSRVVLQKREADPHSDYINANFVNGYKQEKAFIFTQGPLPRTFSDFWHMIWEQQVLVIVMTTRCMERGRNKCGQYWPLEQGSSIIIDDLSVENKCTSECEDFVETMLHLKDEAS